MGEEWLVRGDAVKADIQSLHDFAAALRAELKNSFGPSITNGITPLLAAQAPFGAGGLPEGKFFRLRHKENAKAISELLKDVTMGINALAMAADSIAFEYGATDAFASATQDKVFDAFHPLDGNKTLQGVVADAAAQGNGQEPVIPPAYTDPNGTPGGNAGPYTGHGVYDPRVISPDTGYSVDLTDNEQTRGESVDPSNYPGPKK